MKFLVLGGGAQGSACADADPCGSRDLLLPFVGGKLERRVVDARDTEQVRGAMRGVDVVDLGGNTEIVSQQKELSDLRIPSRHSTTRSSNRWKA